jgi:hypothetical protein
MIPSPHHQRPADRNVPPPAGPLFLTRVLVIPGGGPWRLILGPPGTPRPCQVLRLDGLALQLLQQLAELLRNGLGHHVLEHRLELASDLLAKLRAPGLALA